MYNLLNLQKNLDEEVSINIKEVDQECLKKYFLEVKDPKWVKSSFFDIFKSKKK